MKYLKFSIDELIEVIQTLMLKSVILKMILMPKKYEKCNVTLKTIRSDNVNELIFARLIINSIRKKIEFLATQVKGKIDILMISETKIDESFPPQNFLIEGFSTA